MPKMLGIDVAALIAKHASPGVQDAQLVKVTPGTRTPGALTGGTNPVDGTAITCKGFIESQATRNREGTLVGDGSVIIVLLAATIDGGATVPELGDKITIEGTEYRIPEDGVIDRDPAGATFTCKARVA